MSDGNDLNGVEMDPTELFETHRATGEPLSIFERDSIVAAGLAGEDEFDMTGGGCYVHSPTFADPDADGDDGPTTVPLPSTLSTVEELRHWLTGEVDRWCQREGLSPHGEGENLGDLYREFDIADVFTRMGVTAVPAYERHILYLIGPDAGWIVSTGIELGVEYESVWFDPLNSLRLDVPVAEVVAYREHLRRTADEITAALDRGEGP